MSYELRNGYFKPDGYGFPESAVIPAVYPANPTHVYHLEENAAGPFADAVTLDGDLELAVSGSALTQIPGIYGFGLSSQHETPSTLLCLGDPQLPASADFSVTFWMRLSAGLDANAGYSLYSQITDGTQGLTILPSGIGNTLQYNDDDPGEVFLGTKPISDNTWANVTFTYKHSTKNFKAYVNGVVDINLTLSVGFDGTAQYFVIGAADGLFARNYDFDEVGTFDRELTQDEVTALQTAFYPN